LFILPVNQFISDKLFICRWHTQVWVWYPFLLWLLFTHFKWASCILSSINFAPQPKKPKTATTTND